MEWVADVIAVAAALWAAAMVRDMDARRRSDRERMDRLYSKMNHRLSDHIKSRIHL